MYKPGYIDGAPFLFREDQVGKRGHGFRHRGNDRRGSLDRVVNDTIQQAFIGPGELADIFCPDQATAAFQGVERPAQSGQGFRVARVLAPDGELLGNPLLLFPGLFQEDVQEFFVYVFFYRLRRRSGRLGGRRRRSGRLGGRRRRSGRFRDRWRRRWLGRLGDRRFDRGRRGHRPRGDRFGRHRRGPLRGSFGGGTWRGRGGDLARFRRGSAKALDVVVDQIRQRLAGVAYQIAGIGLALAQAIHVKLNGRDGLGQQFQFLADRRLALVEIADTDFLGNLIQGIGGLLFGKKPQGPADAAKQPGDILQRTKIIGRFDQRADRLLRLGHLHADFLQGGGQQGLPGFARFAAGHAGAAESGQFRLHIQQALGNGHQLAVVGRRFVAHHDADGVRAMAQMAHQLIRAGDHQGVGKVSDQGLELGQAAPVGAAAPGVEVEGILDRHQFAACLGNQHRDRLGTGSGIVAAEAGCALLAAQPIDPLQFRDQVARRIGGRNARHHADQQVLRLFLGPVPPVFREGLDDAVEMSDERLGLGIGLDAVIEHAFDERFRGQEQLVQDGFLDVHLQLMEQPAEVAQALGGGGRLEPHQEVAVKMRPDLANDLPHGLPLFSGRDFHVGQHRGRHQQFGVAEQTFFAYGAQIVDGRQERTGAHRLSGLHLVEIVGQLDQRQHPGLGGLPGVGDAAFAKRQAMLLHFLH